MAFPLHNPLGLSPPSFSSSPNPNISPHYPFLHLPRRRLYTLSPLRHRTTNNHLRPITCSSSSSSPSEEDPPESQPSATELPPQSQPTTSTATELGEEIRNALEERREKKYEGGDLLSGVVEEVGEIEWPAFGKVLGTTGVVLGVIAGSSVVLLTVNAVFAELSDKVFAGRGIQDFFG